MCFAYCPVLDIWACVGLSNSDLIIYITLIQAILAVYFGPSIEVFPLQQR